MGQPTPAQLAEVPAHPAITDRLVEQLHDLGLLLGTGDTATFVEGTVARAALDALRGVADDVAERADKLQLTVRSQRP